MHVTLTCNQDARDHIGSLVFAYNHWVRAKTNRNELADALCAKTLTLVTTPEGREWMDALVRQYGELIALKPLKTLRGLSGYPKQSFWQYVFKIGVPMDLVVTRTHLLFFEPAFGSGAKMTSVNGSEVVRTSLNYGDGSQLHVRTRKGFIRCKVGWSMDAKPIWNVIKEVFFSKKNAP